MRSETLRQRWRQVADKIDVMTLRERAIIFATAVALLVVTFNALLWEPLRVKQKKMPQELAKVQEKMVLAQSQIQEVLAAHQRDPNDELRRLRDELATRSAKIEELFGELSQDFVSPQKKLKMLEDVLQQDGRVELLSLRTLAPVRVMPVKLPGGKKKQEASSRQLGLYLHSAQIVVEGSYGDLLQYLEAVERLPWRIYWSDAALEVREYPHIRMTVTMYTLGLEDTWLSV